VLVAKDDNLEAIATIKYAYPTIARIERAEFIIILTLSQFRLFT